MLIDATTPFGEIIEYSPAPSSYHDYVNTHAPSGLSSKEFCRTFKKDLALEFIVEKTTDTDIYFVELNANRDDELYYFNRGDIFFHGEKIWSEYHHPFLWSFQHIVPSCIIEQPCWFAGTKNNYTHQLLDFLPNLLLREELNTSPDISGRLNVFGKMNAIVDSLKESEAINKALTRDKIFLNDHGIVNNIGNWNVRCIRFRDLAIPKHISIFKAYNLLEHAFSLITNKIVKNLAQPINGMGFLIRNDGRIENSSELEAHLTTCHNTSIINPMTQLSYTEKSTLLKQFDTLLLPPGSDNINAFCFAPKKTKFIQLTPIPNQDILTSPFYSYAGIRYLLPFMDRIILVPSIAAGSQGLNSGKWCTHDIDKAIFQANTT